MAEIDKNVDAFEAAIDPEAAPVDQTQDGVDSFEAAITPQQVNGELTQERWGRIAGTIYGVLTDPNEMALLDGMPDAKAEAQKAAKQRAMQLTAQMQSAIQNQLEIVQTPEQAERVLGEALAQQQVLQQREQEPLAVERTYVEMTAEEADRDIVLRLAAHEAAVNMMAEVADERDWADTAGDFFTSTFLPMRETWDNDDVVKAIAEDPQIAHLAGETLVATARRVAQLSGEEQLAIVPALHEAVLRAVDNHLLFYDTNPNVDVAMSIINALFSASPDERVRNLEIAGYAEIAFDVATMGTTAVVGTRALKGVGAAASAARTGQGALAAGKALAAEIVKKATTEEMAKSSVINVAANAGNVGKAAKLSIMAMLDGDMAKRMGVTDVDMALQALPHPTAQWYREQLADPNMTGEMQLELQKSLMQAGGQALAMREAKEAMQFGALTPDSQRAAQDTWMEKAFPKLQADYMTQGYILENPRIVSGDHKGFKFQYTIRKAEEGAADVTEEVAAKGVKLTDAEIMAIDNSLPKVATTRTVTREVVQETTTSGGTAGADAQLAKQLKGARSRYNYGTNSVEPLFESDVDKAIYIASSKGNSKRKQEYIKFLLDNGVDEETIKRRGKAIRDYLKPIAKKGEVKTPPVPKGDVVLSGGRRTTTETEEVPLTRDEVLEAKRQRGRELQRRLEEARKKKAANQSARTPDNEAPAKKQKLGVREGEVTYKISDETGVFTATAEDKVYQDYGNVLSPSAASVRTEAGDFNYEVAIQGVMSGVESATLQRLTNFARWAMNPVSGIGKAKARQRVDQAIMAGDEYINANGVAGRTFTVTELMAGVDFRGVTVRLTNPDEIKAYYRYRAFADAMQTGENYTMLRELELGGFKDVKLNTSAVSDPTAWQVFAKPLDVGHAKRVAGKARGEGVFTSRDGQVVNMSPELVDEIYESGDMLVRIKGSERNGGWNTAGNGDLDVAGERVQWARVSPTQVRELGHRMPVPYKHGYAPLVNHGEWAVKMAVPVKTRGRSVPDRTQVSRLFDSLEDAKRFREEQIQKMIGKQLAKGDVDGGEARAAAERVWPEVENVGNQSIASRIEDAVGPHGGLFSGHRSKDELMFGVKGERPDRVSPLSLMGRYTSHMAGILTRNEQRIGAEKRWLNTVAEIFPEVPQRGFGATVVDNNTKAGKALNRMKREIEEWNAIPSIQENWLQSLMQKLHDRALNGVNKYIPGISRKESIPLLMWLKHTNPVNAIKAANMHLFMGALNPRQLYMQASAALIAMTKYPNLTGAALRDSMYISFMDNIRNETAWGKVGKMLLKDDQVTEEFFEMYEAWRKSGFYEGMYANADWAKFSTDGLGVGADAMRNLSNLSLSFYRIGEGFNRRISFLIEYQNWKRTSGKIKPTQQDIEGIVEEAQKNMIQLERYNRAWWQGGSGTGMVRQIAGMATQFMQVPMKTMELALRSEGRGGFTRAQRARIFLSQAVLFGTAGIPAGTLVVNGIGKAWESVTGTELSIDPEVANAVNQGFAGFMANTMAGTDLDVASSVAPASGAFEMIQDIIMSEDPLYVKALGAAYNGVLGRGWEAIGALTALSFYDRTGEVDLTPEQLKLAALSIGRMTSTGRNYLKAKIMRDHNKLLSNRGRVIEERDFEDWTELGVVWGLRTRSENMLWDYRNWERDREETIRDMVDVRLKLMHDAIYVLGMDPQKLVGINHQLQMLDEIATDDIKQEVKERVHDIIFDNSGKGGEYGEAVSKYLNKTLVEALDRDAARFTSGGIRSPQQTLPETEE